MISDEDEEQYEYYKGHGLISRKSPVETQKLLEQNLENQQQLYINEGTMHYDTAESRAIIEKLDQLSNSFAVDANTYTLLYIVVLTLIGEIMTENNNNYSPNILTPGSIDREIVKFACTTILIFILSGQNPLKNKHDITRKIKKRNYEKFQHYEQNYDQVDWKRRTPTVRKIKKYKLQYPIITTKWIL